MTSLWNWLGAGLLWGTFFFALASLVAATLLRRAHPSTRAVLFGLVLLKFAVPFGPSLPTSLASAAKQVETAGARVLLGTPTFQPASSWSVPATARQALISLWATFVVAIGARRLLRARKLRLAMANLAPAPTALVEQVRLACARLEVPLPRVVQGALGPSVSGLWQPVLVLPAAAGEALDAMLVHELTHLKRRDLWLQAAQTVVETLFFFWPVVRLAGRSLSLAREQACDLAVVEAQVISPTHYAELLFRAGHQAGSLAMAAKPSHLERRIDMLLNEGKLRPMWWALTLTAVVGLAGSAVGAGATPDPAQPTVMGSLDKSIIQKVVHRHRNEIEACYEAVLEKSPSAAGKMVMGWTIGASGHVRDVVTESSTIDAKVPACASDKIATWVFPEPYGGGVVKVSYPFVFANSGK